MADPLTWMAIASAVGAVGSYQQGRQQEKVAGYQAQLMEQNAGIEMINAEQSGREANAREEAHSRQIRHALGESFAAGAQSGTGLGGSTGEVYEDSSINAHLDMLAIRYTGEMESRAHRIQANDLMANAAVRRKEGQNARRSGNIGAAAQLLMAAGYGYGAMTAPPYGSLRIR